MARFATGSVSSFPIPQILLALVAFYVVITYQFFRARSWINSPPTDGARSSLILPGRSQLTDCPTS